jgi:repressor LexA
MSRNVDGTRREQVFDFIVRYKSEHDGIPPTIREIAEGMGMSSTSTVVYYLTRLAKDGKIQMMAGARGIMVTGGQWQYR